MVAPSPLRVCQLISSFHPVVGGAEQATLHLSRELSRRGCTVAVVTRRYPGLSASEEIDGVRVLRAGLPSRTKLGALTYGLHALFLLATRLRQYSIVHAQGPDAQLLTALVAKTILRRRMVVTVHSDPHLQLRIDRPGGGPRFRAVIRWADRIGVLGPHVARTLESEGVPADKLELLPNGVDTSRFTEPSPEERAQLREDLGLEPEVLVGVFVGRLVPLKRVDLLLRAWSRTAASERGHLLVVGDGPEAGALAALAQEVAPHSVHMLGRRDAPERVLKAADLFFLPSQREGLSMALLEAMACGLAPIVSDLEPNRAVVEDGVTGFVFRTDDQADLERVLTDALSSPLAPVRAAAAAQVQAQK